jgi:hypothetical protein
MHLELISSSKYSNFLRSQTSLLLGFITSKPSTTIQRVQSGDGGNAHKAKLQLGSNSQSDPENKYNSQPSFAVVHVVRVSLTFLFPFISLLGADQLTDPLVHRLKSTRINDLIHDQNLLATEISIVDQVCCIQLLYNVKMSQLCI